MHPLYTDKVGGIQFSIEQDDRTYYQDLGYFFSSSGVEQVVINIGIITGVDPDRYVTPGYPGFDRFFPYYTLTNILSLYGAPSQVLVFPFPNPRTIDPDWFVPQEYRFTILLVYEEQGFLVVYDAMREIQDESYVGCPANALINLTSWSIEEHTWLDSLEHLNHKFVNDYDLPFFKSIEEATGMSLDEFYEFYRNPYHHGCLETPISIWE